jgi:hypothetical protein
MEVRASDDPEPFLVRALRRNSEHRRNLESYAFLLNARGRGDSLVYYQKAVVTYYEHWTYRVGEASPSSSPSSSSSSSSSPLSSRSSPYSSSS